METKAKFLTTKQMTLIALMTALTCILGPLSIPLPFSPVPISFTNLVLYFSVFVLGTKFSTISYIVYLLIGLVGLPVFSGFSGGPAKVARYCQSRIPLSVLLVRQKWQGLRADIWSDLCF